MTFLGTTDKSGNHREVIFKNCLVQWKICSSFIVESPAVAIQLELEIEKSIHLFVQGMLGSVSE